VSLDNVLLTPPAAILVTEVKCTAQYLKAFPLLWVEITKICIFQKLCRFYWPKKSAFEARKFLGGGGGVGGIGPFSRLPVWPTLIG